MTQVPVKARSDSQVVPAQAAFGTLVLAERRNGPTEAGPGARGWVQDYCGITEGSDGDVRKQYGLRSPNRGRRGWRCAGPSGRPGSPAASWTPSSRTRFRLAYRATPGDRGPSVWTIQP